MAKIKLPNCSITSLFSLYTKTSIQHFFSSTNVTETHLLNEIYCLLFFLCSQEIVVHFAVGLYYLVMMACKLN